MILRVSKLVTKNPPKKVVATWQAHRNSFRWGPLYIDIGLEQLEAFPSFLEGNPGCGRLEHVVNGFLIYGIVYLHIIYAL